MDLLIASVTIEAQVSKNRIATEGTVSPEKLLRSDLLRSAWMFAVGALDAYFCDAYTDVIAAMASSKNRQPAITLPEWAYDIKFPLRASLKNMTTRIGGGEWLLAG